MHAIDLQKDDFEMVEEDSEDIKKTAGNLCVTLYPLCWGYF